jgi:hypothetical protein
MCGSVGATPPPPLLVQSVGVQHLQVASPGRLQELSTQAGGCGDWRAATSSETPLRMPPPLRRQNASRFSWPPDRQQEWLYIRLSPAGFVEQAAFSLGLQLSVRQVWELYGEHASPRGARVAMQPYSTTT